MRKKFKKLSASGRKPKVFMLGLISCTISASNCMVMRFSLIIIFLHVANILVLSDITRSKYNRLLELSKSSTIIGLNFDQFQEYVYDSPRNYSVFLMLTALKNGRNCHGCQAANDEFTLVGNSLSKNSAFTKGIFLASADFDDNPQIFKALNQNTVPVFIHFPSFGNPTKDDYLDISKNGFGAEIISRWILSRSSVEIPIVRPPSYTGMVLLCIVAVLGCILLYIRPDNLEYIFTRSTISYTAMIVIFYMISGQVWNSIRHPPIFHTPEQGGIAFFYPGADFQFVSETVIVMVTYVLITVSFVILNDVNQSADAGKRRMMAITGLGMLTVFVSVLISLFRRKYQGYPYSFLLK